MCDIAVDFISIDSKLEMIFFLQTTSCDGALRKAPMPRARQHMMQDNGYPN
jgi:hypothetical protein